jgi:long-chain acyl-CoA synthetase
LNFLEDIFARIRQALERPVLREARDGTLVSASGAELLGLVAEARGHLARACLKKGDRCALLGHNSIRWVAADLALMAEGIIVVPLYARQAPAELVAIMQDCQPSMILCGDEALREAITKAWPDAPPRVLLIDVFAGATAADRVAAPAALSATDPVTIIYTSGTSGEAKGVILTVGNVNHMLPCTTARLDQLMGSPAKPDSVFHYLPFCFAGSWILVLTALSRASVLTLSTDLTKLADELRLAEPHYFLNVPTLLERIRNGVEENLAKRGGMGLALFRSGQAAWGRKQSGKSEWLDAVRLALANWMVFSPVRQRLGPNLRALICGSAPLAKETQLFFHMLGIRVLQVYGLTETTAICTLDDPRHVEPGRVGPAIPGIEMRAGENDEILVRGPNIFPGYWNRPAETARVLNDGWFHTGDQGEVNEAGNWRIVGRLKNLIILNSGHNVAPEAMEEKLRRALPGAEQVLLVGNGRGYLTAIVTGVAAHDGVQKQVDRLNAGLPHYKQVRAFHLEKEPFTIENGLLTANGKLKRDAILARFAGEIEAMYCRKEA